MKLSEAFAILKTEDIALSLSGDCTFEKITCDSREVENGTLFFVKGANFKEEYLFSAIEKGAVAYISEKEYPTDLAHITVNNVRLAMPLLAKTFYENPADKLLLTGVTGTKGKTTVAFMLRNIFREYFGDGRVGMISTNGAFCGKRPIEKTGTTPEALPLYGIFDEFYRSGVSAAVMEVSSQALQYNRVEYVPFFNGIYLNLSPDHLSPTEHHSFEEYKNAKLRMLTLCKNGAVNIDDEYAEEVVSAATCEKLYTFGIEKEADFRATNVCLSKSGSTFTVNGVDYSIRMPGFFNIYNALAAIVAATISGVSSSAIRKGLEKTVIDGRMEIIEKGGRTVIVDYAHNALSFSAVFDYVDRFYPDSKKICLFGCQGNKAYDRREELPAIAGKKADFVVLTSDDPAREDPEAILSEVENNLKKTGAEYKKITDREEAVRFAVGKAKKGDVVFLAGKGHEHTQIVGTDTVYYKGDAATAKEVLDEE